MNKKPLRKPIQKKKKKQHYNAYIVPEGERECPICEQKMQLDITERVKVDVCEKHGIWLDKGELLKITDQIHRNLNITNSFELKEIKKSAKFDGKVQGTLFGIWSFLWD